MHIWRQSLGFSVSVLTIFGSEAKRWQEALATRKGFTEAIKTEDDKDETILGKLARVTSDPSEVIPEADVVVFVMPAFAHASYLKAIKPHLAQKKTLICGFPGSNGFELEVKFLLGPEISDRITLASAITLPWNCRVETYGVRVKILGTKTDAEVSVAPDEETKRVLSLLQRLVGPQPRLTALNNMLEASLMSINAVWHPPM